jgi:hypothetical protein
MTDVKFQINNVPEVSLTESVIHLLYSKQYSALIDGV